MKKCILCDKEEPGNYFSTNGMDYVCEDCLDEMLNNLNDLRQKEGEKCSEKLINLTPSKIKEYLDQYVIGQDKAKITLSTVIYNHFLRINAKPSKDNDVVVQKSNVLIIGDSGVGKTHIIQTLTKLLDIPFVIADSTAFTASGLN